MKGFELLTCQIAGLRIPLLLAEMFDFSMLDGATVDYRILYKLHLLSVLRGRPQAAARIAVSKSCPEISGTVQFYQTNEDVVI